MKLTPAAMARIERLERAGRHDLADATRERIADDALDATDLHEDDAAAAEQDWMD